MNRKGICEEVFVTDFDVLIQHFVWREGGHVALTKNRKRTVGLDSSL